MGKRTPRLIVVLFIYKPGHNTNKNTGDINTHTTIDASRTYPLRPKILVRKMNVSRCILVVDTFICIHFYDKYFRAELVQYYSVHNKIEAGECESLLNPRAPCCAYEPPLRIGGQFRWAAAGLLQVVGPPRARMPPTKTSKTRRISISRTEVAEEFFFAILDRSALWFLPCCISTWIAS